MAVSDVIIIGAGPSGLAAGYRLAKAGVNVRVLEKDYRVGGKMRTTVVDGFMLDQGALLIPTTYTTLLSLAREAGMANDIVPGGFVLAEMREGTVHNLDGDHLLKSVLDTKLLSTSAKLEALKLLPDIWRSRKADFDHMPECGKYDTQTIAQWVEGKFSDEVKTYLIGAILRGIFATRMETASKVDFLAILNLFAGAKLVGFRNGMESYAEKLAENLDVTFGVEVISVSEGSDNVAVTWRNEAGDHVENADACVIALPAATVLQIYPTLDPWRTRFLSRVRHGKSGVLSIGLTKAPGHISATYIMIPETEHPFVAGIMLDHNKVRGRAPEGAGLLSVAVMEHWCEANWHLSDDELAQKVLAGVLSLLPELEPDIAFVKYHRWFLEYNQPGHYRDLRTFRDLCAKDRRVQLAGDFHSMGGLNPATIAGLNAAERILDL